MPETPIDERKFTDREVREILKKAVEKPPSRAPSAALAQGEGLSLAELKTIGQEVGIDANRLEDAARAVAADRGTHLQRILGTPSLLHVERKVEGELTPEDAPEILALIRRTMGRHGKVNQIQQSLEWSAKGESGSRHVAVSSKDGTTAISASANLSNLPVIAYLPAGFVGVFASIMGAVGYSEHGNIVALIAGLSVLPILYPILQAILSRISKSESAKLQRVVEDLTRLAEEAPD